MPPNRLYIVFKSKHLTAPIVVDWASKNLEEKGRDWVVGGGL